jgi:phospholipase A1
VVVRSAALYLLALTFTATAAEREPCAAIGDDAARLQCYDAQAAEARTQLSRTAGADALSNLAAHWETEPAAKRGTFLMRAHKPNYFLLARWSDDPNQQPSSPAPGHTVLVPQGWEDTEIKFQLSFKTKLAESLWGGSTDLWFGYTQQSHWQLYYDLSAPFRETNYNPELFATVRTDYDLLGLQGRFVNLGIEHQSNGRSLPRSRSWNRLYAQAGLERDRFALLVKPWYRLKEDVEDDDNPDISEYAGRIEILGLYKRAGHVLSLQLRNNLRLSPWRSGQQFDWAFPLAGNLKGHVQLFSGYGESLIDYNWRQTTVGIGVSLTEWM